MKKSIFILSILLLTLCLFSCGISEAENGISDGYDDSGFSESNKNDKTDGTDTDSNLGKSEQEAVEPIVFEGDYLNLDLLGSEYGDSDVLAIETVEELAPYLDIISARFASDLQYMADLGAERITTAMMNAMRRYKKAEEFFENKCNWGFFVTYKILLIKSESGYARDWMLADVNLKRDAEKKILQIDSFELTTGMGSDAVTYGTYWVAVPQSLNIDYEKDVKLNSISCYDFFSTPPYVDGYKMKTYNLTRWGWVYSKEMD